MNGNLTLAPGATYAVEITPDAADRTTVSGSASLDGALAVTAADGTYAAGQRYTLISAGTGVTGTFSSFTTTGLPGYVQGRLGYDASTAYLYLDPVSLASGNPPGEGGGASALDNAVQGGAVLPSGFSALYALSGAALDTALDQVSGQIGANTATTAAQSVSPFLMLMQSQGADPQGIRPAQLSSGGWRFWASAFGGHTGISADASSGAAGLSASNYGFAGGAEIGLAGNWTVGGSAAIGRQDFRSGNGTGKSDDVLLGLYAHTSFLGQGYVAAALSYGWHDIATSRVVTVLGTDVLVAKLGGESLGGRIEAGYTLASDSPYEITPFAAFAGQNFDAPAYGETAASGSPVFALSYAAQQTGTQQTELGARLARLFALDGGSALSGSLRAAWAHQLEAAPFAVASFQGLPGSSFQVLGVRAATDTALLGINLDVREAGGFSYGIRLNTQLGAGTTIYGGMGTLAWRL